MEERTLDCQPVEIVTPEEWAEMMAEAEEAGSHIDEQEERSDGSTRYVLAVPIGGGWDRRAYVVRWAEHFAKEGT